MRVQNCRDHSREAPLELLAAADVAHLHPVPFASDQSCFPERPKMLRKRGFGDAAIADLKEI
jgi:hypothetical protein